MVLAAERLTPADRVIAISMSGNVDRTVEAAVAVNVFRRGADAAPADQVSAFYAKEIFKSRVDIDIATFAVLQENRRRDGIDKLFGKIEVFGQALRQLFLLGNVFGKF